MPAIPTFPSNRYPYHVNRNVRAGDSNPPNKPVGAPTDDTRVYMANPPSGGLFPPGATYEDDTTLIGRLEEITSLTINRALYGLHSAIDAIGERPTIPITLLRPSVAGAPGVILNLSDNTVFPGSNRSLVYIGPDGTTAANATKYVKLLADRDGTVPPTTQLVPKRTDDLKLIEVNDVLTKAVAGTSLYAATTPTEGFFPDGTPFELHERTFMNAIQPAYGGGVEYPEPVNPQAGHCLFNYSYAMRLAQTESDFSNFWKAFAIIVSVTPGPSPWTLHLNRVVPEWQDQILNHGKGDIIYYVRVACRPGIQLNYSVTPATTDCLVFGGYDRLMNGLHHPEDKVVADLNPFAASLPLYPCIDLSVPAGASVFGWDWFGSMFRASIARSDKTGFVALDGIHGGPSAAYNGYGSFVHLQNFEANNYSILTTSGTFTKVAGNTIEIAAPFRFCVPSPGVDAGKTDVIPGIDLIELIDASGGVGTWYIMSVDAANSRRTTLRRLDGDMTGAGVPASGTYKVYRPIMRMASDDASGLHSPSDGRGLILVAPYAIGHETASKAIQLISPFDASAPIRLLEGYHTNPYGEQFLGGYIDSAGMFSMTRGRSQYGFEAWPSFPVSSFTGDAGPANAGFVDWDYAWPSVSTVRRNTGFAHWTYTEFDLRTKLHYSAGNNEVTCSGNAITLVDYPTRRFGSTSAPIQTDLTQYIDGVEVYEKTGGTVGKRLGIWVLVSITAQQTATFMRMSDGDYTGAGLPSVTGGYIRPLRFTFRECSQLGTAWQMNGVQIANLSDVDNSTALFLFTDKAPAGTSYFLRCRSFQYLGSGTPTEVATIDENGSVWSKADVKADNDVYADSEGDGNGDFKYGAAHTFYRAIGAAQANTIILSNDHSKWSWAGGEYALCTAKPPADTDWLRIPLVLPDGAYVTEIAIQYRLAVTVTGNEAKAILTSADRSEAMWSTPGTYTPTSTPLAIVSMGQVVALNSFYTYLFAPFTVGPPASFPFTVNKNNIYYFDIRPVWNVNNALDRFYGIRVKYTIGLVRPW